ncbi:MAG: hypothetical protein ACXV4A_14550 [Actinomycetes bacterium]
MSRIRPVLIPVLAAVASLALLTGCGAGFSAQTVQTYAPADGVLGNNGSIRVVNALVVAGDGATTGVVSMSVVNVGDRADRLTGIESSGGTVDLTGSGVLRAGQSVRFGAGTDPAATIGGLTARPGKAITLRLTFARSEPITLRTVVVPATGDYAQLTPGPETPAAESPSPSDSPTSSESTSGSASPSPSSS